MKNFAMLTFGIALLFSCEAPQEEPTEKAAIEISTRADEYKEVFEQHLAALMTSDSTGVLATVAPGFVSYGMYAEIDTSDVQKEINVWNAVNPRRSNQSIEAINYTTLTVNEGEYVGDWLQYWGNYNVTENEAEIQLPFYASALMEDGKLKQLFLYADRLGYLQKVGFKLDPPEGY